MVPRRRQQFFPLTLESSMSVGLSIKTALSVGVLGENPSEWVTNLHTVDGGLAVSRVDVPVEAFGQDSRQRPYLRWEGLFPRH